MDSESELASSELAFSSSELVAVTFSARDFVTGMGVAGGVGRADDSVAMGTLSCCGGEGRGRRVGGFGGGRLEEGF